MSQTSTDCLPEPISPSGDAGPIKRLLLVDDDPLVLHLLKQELRDLREKWQMEFAPNAIAALDLMSRAPVDVIVTDVLMPDMNGAVLLEKVMRQWPATVRIAFTTPANFAANKGLVAPAHQHVAKGGDFRALRDALDRLLGTDQLLSNGKFRQTLAGMSSLPSLPSLYVDLLQELNSDDPSLERVGRTIAKDLGLSARILQLANSAFFGRARAVSDPGEAVMYMGVETTKALVLSLKVLSQVHEIKIKEFNPDQLFKHSWATALMAKTICEMEFVNRTTADEAFIAGLLHDVGKLVFATNFPENYQLATQLSQKNHLPFFAAEQQIYGATHAEVGAYLLAIWGLSSPIVEAVAHHHQPMRNATSAFTPTTAVHVANFLSNSHHHAEPNGIHDVDQDYLKKIGLGERFKVWREACLEKAKGANL